MGCLSVIAQGTDRIRLDVEWHYGPSRQQELINWFWHDDCIDYYCPWTLGEDGHLARCWLETSTRWHICLSECLALNDPLMILTTNRAIFIT